MGRPLRRRRGQRVQCNEDGRLVGEDHPRAKLTDHDVDLIRELHEEHGMSTSMIARKFEITPRWALRLVQYTGRVSSPVGVRALGIPSPRRRR